MGQELSHSSRMHRDIPPPNEPQWPFPLSQMRKKISTTTTKTERHNCWGQFPSRIKTFAKTLTDVLFYQTNPLISMYDSDSIICKRNRLVYFGLLTASFLTSKEWRVAEQTIICKSEQTNLQLYTFLCTAYLLITSLEAALVNSFSQSANTEHTSLHRSVV